MKWQDLPPQLLYPALIPHVIKLCIKYRALPSFITKSNPAFPYGGLPFAPKHKMFSHFPGILPYTLIKTYGNPERKKAEAEEFAKKTGYPLIAKPDQGHRGIDVRLINTPAELESLLKRQKWDYILQEYCDYPHEFGIFYAKLPNEPKARIVSLTHKIIPEVTGDGKNSLKTLIMRSKAENKNALLKKHAAELDKVLQKGEKRRLLVTASHCQGAMFYDAHKMITPELEKKVLKECDVQGFNFGRLDVKAKNVGELKKGRFEILEVNGATSEFIHVYDNKITWKQGVSELKKQWNMLFAIADNNRHHKSMRFAEFISKYIKFFATTKKATGKYW